MPSILFTVGLALAVANTAPSSLDVNQHHRGVAMLEDLASNSPSLLGLGLRDSLTDLVAIRSGDDLIVRGLRAHQGYPVFNESVAVRFGNDGQIKRLNADLRPLELISPPTHNFGAARAIALSRVFGGKWAAEIFTSKHPDDALGVKDGRWTFRVSLTGWTPEQQQDVWLDAETLQILDVTNRVRYLEAQGNVFTTHPFSDDLSADVSQVQLENIDEPEDGLDVILTGSYAKARSCFGDRENVQVLTCDDLVPIFLGFPTTCDNPQVASFVPAEFKHIALAVCSPQHRAVANEDTAFTDYQPIDDEASVSEYPFPAFTDEFSELMLYWHVDDTTTYFRSLGLEEPDRPLPALANLVLPSQPLLDCGTEGMTAADATDNATGVEVIDACLAEFEAEQKLAYSPFDNAFFSPGVDGNFINTLLGTEGDGIFFGQGTMADFAYDGDVITHEFGHYMASYLGALQEQGLKDEIGTNDSPGAMNEGFADFFAGARTADAIMGGYVGLKAGFGDRGIRVLDHSLVCPEYWVGEVHEDGMGLGGGLWAARELYPQTITDEVTGLEVRVFDRAALAGLSMITSNATQDRTVEEILAAIAAEPGLEDPEAALATAVMTERNLVSCLRVRSMDEEPIELLFLEGTGGGGGGPFGGGPNYQPYAPGPVQLSFTKPDGVDALECIEVQMQVAQRAASGEGTPDLPIGGMGGGDAALNVALLAKANAPVSFSYSGSNVTADAADYEFAFVESSLGGATILKANALIPEGADVANLALVNRGSDQVIVGNIKVLSTNTDCPVIDPTDASDASDPSDASDASDTSDSSDASDVSDTGSKDDDGGCNSASGASAAAIWGLLAYLGRRRRR